MSTIAAFKIPKIANEPNVGRILHLHVGATHDADAAYSNTTQKAPRSGQA